MIFLATIQLRTSYYEGKSQVSTVQKIVIADSEASADRKIQDYYDKKCSEYSVSYTPQNIQLEPAIE